MSGPRRTFDSMPVTSMMNVPYPALEAAGPVRPSPVVWRCNVPVEGPALLVPSARTHPTTARGARRDRGRGGGAAARNFPGLIPELDRLAPGIEYLDPDLDGEAIVDRALALARTKMDPYPHTDSGPDHRPATRVRFSGRQVQTRLRPDAVDVLAHRCQAAHVDSGRRRRRVRNRICRHRRNLRTTRSRSIRISGWVSCTPSGTCGIRRSCPIMLRCSNVGTRPATVGRRGCPRHPQMVRRTHPPRHPQRPRRWLRRRRRPPRGALPDTITGEAGEPGSSGNCCRVHAMSAPPCCSTARR